MASNGIGNSSSSKPADAQSWGQQIGLNDLGETEENGKAEAGKGGKAKGKGATSKAASLLVSGGQAASPGDKPSVGGSLSLLGDQKKTVDPSLSEPVGALADAHPLGAAADELVILDGDPVIADAQEKLYDLMADPTATAEELEAAVADVKTALTQAGRSDELLETLGNSMPASSSESDMASVYAMAAKLGVDLDGGKDKVVSARNTAALNKATRDAQKQAAKDQEARMAAYNAQMQAQAQAKAPVAQASYAKNNGGSATGSGGSGGSGSASGSGGSGGTNSAGGTKTSTPAANTGGAPPSYASGWNGGKVAPSTEMSANQTYSGPASNYPNDTSTWASYESLWAKAESQMTMNTPEQNAWVKEAIDLEAQKTGVDARFILATVMQESSGRVNAPTTNNGVNNPGLMQSHNGESFSDIGDGGKASIFQMIKDGVEGTHGKEGGGDGLAQCIEQGGDYFTAARLYNSGQVDKSNLNAPVGATPDYPADIANRVMGKK